MERREEKRLGMGPYTYEPNAEVGKRIVSLRQGYLVDALPKEKRRKRRRRNLDNSVWFLSITLLFLSILNPSA